MTKHSNRWFKAPAGIALLAACLLFPPTQVGAQPVALIEEEPGGPAYVAGDILIQINPDATDAEVLDVAERGAFTRMVKHIRTDAMKASRHPGVSHMWTSLPVRQAIEALKNHPAVEFVEPNWVYQHQSSDPYFTGGQLWGMFGDLSLPSNQFGSQAAEAWAAGYTGSGTVFVGVIDEGIQFTHPDLAANIWTNPYDPIDGVDNDGNGYVDDIHGWNCIDNNNVIYTAGLDAHGTHVSGTIGAVGNNSIGVVGVNWNVTIISGKFLGPDGGTTADAIEAVDYFTNLKIKHPEMNLVALNNSWGGGGFSQGLLNAIVRAAQQNILFVAAAGNGDSRGRAMNTDSKVSYPSCYNTTAGAGYDSVISVTAIDSAGSKASWANYGAKTVDLGAPGVGILSTLPSSSYGSYSGTSMATPHVTGAAALYASTHPGATAYEIRNALLASTLATPSLGGKTVTGGRLNLSAVIAPPSPPTIPLTPTGLTPTAGDNRVSLTWNASAGATSYNVKRSSAQSGPYTTITIPGAVTATSYIDTTAVNGTPYYYVVSAENSIGESNDSDAVSATPQAPPPLPTAPSNLRATVVSISRIDVSWTDNSGDDEDGFRIERSTDNRTFTEIAIVGKDVSMFQNTTGLSRNKTYYYRVRAYNSGGTSSYSNTANAKTPKN